MKKVVFDFYRMSVVKFGKKLELVDASMTGNPYFPNQQAAVTILSTAAREFYALSVKAEKRDQDVLIARNASRIHVTNLLHDLGVEVTAVAKGDEVILSSSGFSFTQPRQKSTPLQKPKTPLLASGINSGVINCKTNPQDGMKSATYYITADATALTEGNITGWESYQFGESTFSFTDLIPGQRYYIKVGQVGVRKQYVMSDAVSFIAQ